MTTTEETTQLELYFQPFRANIIGINQEFVSPFGKQKLIYTDWTASGRLYRPIEEKLLNQFGPFVANTHTETSITGSVMTHAYHDAREIIKQEIENDGDGLPWKDKEHYTYLMLDKAFESYKSVHHNEIETYFFDRGILDAICYADMIGLKIPNDIEKMVSKAEFLTSITLTFKQQL